MCAWNKNWIVPRAMVDLDFCNRRWHGGYISETGVGGAGGPKDSLAATSGAYAGTAYTPTKSGILMPIAIPTSQNIPIRITDLGMHVEGVRTNNCLWSRDLTNAAWTKTNGTAAKDQTGNVIGETGSTSSSFAATSASASCLQSITLGSSKLCIFSCYIKAIGTLTGTVKITMDGGTTTQDVTSQLTATGYAWVQMSQTIQNINCGVLLSASGDKVAIDFCQLETSTQTFGILATDKATSPIFTQGSTVARGNETQYFAQNTSAVNNAGRPLIDDFLSSGRPWTMIASFNGDLPDGSGSGGVKGPVFIASDLVYPASLTCGAGLVGFGNNFTNKTANFCNIGRGNWNIGAFTCDYKGTKSCLNGQAPSALNSASVPDKTGGTHFNIFNNGSGTAGATLNGTVGRIAFVPGIMPDGLLQLYTDLSGPFRTWV